MCVIIAKLKDSKLPSKESLQNCFENNPDGAGFMYTNEEGRVIIDKGYMEFNKFYKRYKKLCKRFDDFKGKNLVIHMRISTAGGIRKENTHPFPLTNDFKKMKYLYSKCNVGVVHNGIISEASPSKNMESQGINDTMVFIKGYLYPIYKKWKKCFEDEAFKKGIEIISNSKFAILDKNDNLYMIGAFQKFEEVYYSNDSYKYSIPYRSYISYSYGDYDYEYEKYSKNKKGSEDEELLEDKEYAKKYAKKYENGKTESEENVRDMNSKIECEDSDLVMFNDEYDPIEIYELRTEDNSIFYYDLDDWSLQEIKEGAVINTYYNCYVCDNIA